MIAFFLKHQQGKQLTTRREIQEKNRFNDLFPPKEARVVSGHVAMGIGQVVTVNIPAGVRWSLSLTPDNGV